MSSESHSFTKYIIRFNVEDFLPFNEIWSKKFIIGLNEWQIQLDPNYTKDGINYISVYLYLENSNESKVRAKYSVCVKDVNNEDKYKEVMDINEYQYENDDSGYGLDLFIKRDDLMRNKNKLLPNNVLTLCLVIEVMNENNHKKCNYLSAEEWLKTGQFSDFRFIIGNKVFNVHKVVLTSRSSVLKTMLSTDFKEKQENEVIIEDIDSDVFEEFLNFLYLNKLSKMEEMAEQLLYVSDKYNVIQLKTICEDFLNFDLNTKNAIKTLFISDKYKSQKLKSNAIQLIANNLKDIKKVSKNEWFKFLKDHHLLADQIIESMAKELKQIKPKISIPISIWTFPKL